MKTNLRAPVPRFLLLILSLLLLPVGCGGDGDASSGGGGDSGAADVRAGETTDAPAGDSGGELDEGGEQDVADATDTSLDGDAVADGDTAAEVDSGDAGAGIGKLDFALNWPIFEAPADPLSGAEVESCAVFQEESCGAGGTVRRCDIYDVGAGAFEDEPDDMLLRAYLYDRWYDLHMSPDGQTADRVFNREMPAGTPELEWSDPQHFAHWGGAGDSAIWTGTALNAYILRYLHTGTEADYQRMEEKTRVMLRFFELTRVPGYLARFHFLLVDPGTPLPVDHIFRHGPDTSLDHRDIDDPEGLGFLPEIYFEPGLGTPRWSGDPSIDQYNGPMVAFPMVYGLLRDEALKERIAHHMVCYLHSLRRIEIINLRDNQEALSAFTEVFGGGEGLNLDPGDIDLTALDEIVFYVHPQLNEANEDTYPRECGDFIQTEPWRVLDAASSSFVPDVLTLVQDIDRTKNRRNHINHFYIPSIRGGDAMHMMHLTLMAHAFTGDDRYVDFLEDELMGRIRAPEVAATMGAFIMPRYCRRFYGTNITAGPLWAFNNLLADSPLDTWMQEVFRDEMWAKECADIGNVNVNLMFAGAVSPAIGGDGRAEAIRYALEELPRFGGNGGVLNDPRRTYRQPYDEVVAQMPEGIEPRCATEEERQICERPVTIFGATLDGESISFECKGESSECVMADGLCTTAEASGPLPGPIRYWGDYGWQRSPFRIGRENGAGNVQSPGTDYAEQYWMARFYDIIAGGTEVLAWRDTGEACP